MCYGWTWLYLRPHSDVNPRCHGESSDHSLFILFRVIRTEAVAALTFTHETSQNNEGSASEPPCGMRPAISRDSAFDPSRRFFLVWKIGARPVHSSHVMALGEVESQ